MTASMSRVLVLGLGLMGLPVAVTAQTTPEGAPLNATSVTVAGSEWFLAKSFFARQATQNLKVPSWMGVYRGPEETGKKPPLIQLDVYYFPVEAATQELLLERKSVAPPQDIVSMLPRVDQALAFAEGSPNDPPERRPWQEIRWRRGVVVATVTASPPDPRLLEFARSFLSRDRLLGEWQETSLAVRARDPAGEELNVKGGIQADESFRGWLEAPSAVPMEMAFHVNKVTIQADLEGIRPTRAVPITDAVLALETLDEIVDTQADAQGVARVHLDALSQRRALNLSVTSPNLAQPIRGSVFLRFGDAKSPLSADGRYHPPAPPQDSSLDKLSTAFLDFVSAVYNQDLGAFPVTIDEDRPGPVSTSSARPYLLQGLSWHLARAFGRKDLARELETVLPLEHAASIGSGNDEEKRLMQRFDNAEASLTIYMETEDAAWLELTRAIVQDPQRRPPPLKGHWCEESARRVLVLWRLHELMKDVTLEAEAKSASKQLLAAVEAHVEPASLIRKKEGHEVVPSAGSPGPHAWATLALIKSHELMGESAYWQGALVQASHLLDTHTNKGRLVFSHKQGDEQPLPGLGDGPGAYPETAAALHAFLRVYEGTGNRAFEAAARDIRERVFSYWRPEFGGFGTLQYWDGSLVAGENGATFPVNSKKQASIPQQAWAMLTFFPRFHPYWGPSQSTQQAKRRVLDILFPIASGKRRRTETSRREPPAAPDPRTAE